ncbi:MAG: hypothetical protein Q7S56_03470 [Nanoarchaeota archaeon]|nr:hypothetical protein [Nanoarchaeota archaeon]
MIEQPRFIPLKILNERERSDIIEILQDTFGIKEIEGIMLQRGKERLFLYKGSFTEKQIKALEYEIPIERVGVYFAKIIEDQKSKERYIKLSIEGIQLLKDQITKNIYELESDEQIDAWMKGQDLNIKTDLRGFIAIKYKNDFLGCGKASAEKIGNFIPKTRRLRDKSIIT